MFRLKAAGWILALSATCAAQTNPPSAATLESAIRNGDANAVERQLDAGAPLNGNIGLHTPLTLAIVSDRPAIVSLIYCSAAPTPRLDNLFSRTMKNGRTPSFETIPSLVTNGGGGMPAFGSRMSRTNVNAVLSYLIASSRTCRWSWLPTNSPCAATSRRR
jgi:hypothetical protein